MSHFPTQMSTKYPGFPYAPGNTLRLEGNNEGEKLFVVELEVLRLELPWTLSSGMVVRVQQSTGSPLPGEVAFLKMFDRRYSYE